MKLLLIENDISLLESMKRLLVSKGYYVDSAYDALVGVGYLLNNDYDIAIIDMHLEKISFREIFELKIKHNININVIAITKKELLNTKLLNFEIVANEYLTLPFYSEELLNIIESIKLVDEININNDSFIFNPFYIKNDKGKKYLTLTECLILDYLLKGNNLLIKEYKSFVYKEKDLPIYIDSINNKLKYLGINIKIKIENDYYKVVCL